jgi:malate synthase|tara:strand:+ start:38759 stop:40312 length:1554 start_codon:yes stop_codon:yes gene_type:complete
MVLTTEARAFLIDLHRRFNGRRLALLGTREDRQAEFDSGHLPGFLPETAAIRAGAWSVAPIPAPLLDRRVEITGPVEAKMMINALNSGAQAFMADFEDSASPTWSNMVWGQVNVMRAVRRELTFEDAVKGKSYELGNASTKLLVRFRGWHLDEAHVEVDGEAISASLFDFGLTFFHNAAEQLSRGAGPWYYLAKLEHHEEASLWNDVFVHAQDALGIPRASIKVTVLIETFPAVFQMDEILHALREHICGLNAGRWDYIFSAIKSTRNDPSRVLPERGQVTMDVGFMDAYQSRLVRTTHRRQASAMGGMSAFIPNRRNPEVTERALAAVKADKVREVEMGCDGTWVAHPDLIEVAFDAFAAHLSDKTHQIPTAPDMTPLDSDPTPLQDFSVPDGSITPDGIKLNVDVGIRYTQSWLWGTGAAALNNLMEDAATAEISRYQVWQWVRHSAQLTDGRAVDAALVEELVEETRTAQRSAGHTTMLDEACDLFLETALSPDPSPFLTIPAYQLITTKMVEV